MRTRLLADGPLSNLIDGWCRRRACSMGLWLAVLALALAPAAVVQPLVTGGAG
jgi:hypothetical protein